MIKHIDPVFIKNTILKLDIIRLISKIIPTGKIISNSYKINCPFHKESHPSLFCNRELGVYHCFGCGAKGNVIGFFMRYKNINFVSAVQEISLLENLEVQYVTKTTSAKKKLLYNVLEAAQQCFFSNFALANNYLQSRNIDLYTIEKYQIGFSSNLALLKQSYSEATLIMAGLIKNENNSHDRLFFQERIIFPIRNIQGQVIAFGGRITSNSKFLPKYINSIESLVFKKNHELYGLYEILMESQKHIEEITVVEGYFDVITLACYGYKNAVATLCSSVSLEQAQKLFNFTKKIIFCFDGDSSGFAGTKQALSVIIKLLSELNYDGVIKFASMKGGYDPDKYIQEFGLSAFKQLLEDAPTLSEFFLSLFNVSNIHTLMDQASKILGPIIMSPIKIALIHALANHHQLRYQDLAEILTLNRNNISSSKYDVQQDESQPLEPLLSFLLQEPQQAYKVIQESSINEKYFVLSQQPDILLDAIKMLSNKPYSPIELSNCLINNHNHQESLILKALRAHFTYSELEFRLFLKRIFINPYKKKKITTFLTEITIQ